MLVESACACVPCAMTSPGKNSSSGWLDRIGRQKAIVVNARQQLDRLGSGQELERVPYGTVTYCLPPSTTVT